MTMNTMSSATGSRIHALGVHAADARTRSAPGVHWPGLLGNTLYFLLNNIVINIDVIDSITLFIFIGVLYY
jgi:hypothetical protein